MTYLNRLLTVFLVLIGGALVWLGAQLILAGGSLYYAPAGGALLATAWALWKQSSIVLRIYAGLWIATLIWALWESGLNGWALAARLGLLTGIGLWLLTPWVRRSLGVTPTTALSRSLLGLVLAGLISGTGWLFWNDRITGGMDLATFAGAPADERAGNWLHYGNRCNPLEGKPIG
jgi:quinoprotein glucose dehydrogenase